MTHRTSRRDFLKSAAIGLPTVLSASALAAPSDRLTLGHIGIGKMARGHLNSMVGRSNVQVLAVCDVQSIRLGTAKKQVDGRYKNDACMATTDFRKVIERKDIDAVLIATPDHWHAIPAIHAAQAGKDIYCEKPLSLTIREARAMVNAVRRYGRVFQTGSQQRSTSNFRFACEMVRSGRIGKVHTVHVNVGGPSTPCHLPPQKVRGDVDWDMWLGPAPWRPFHETVCPPVEFGGWPQWRRFRDYSGGGMTDMGAHHFDIAQWGLGMERWGPIEIIPPNGKEHKYLTYRYANGIKLHHGGGESSIEWKGDKGRVLVSRGGLNTDPADLMRTPTQSNEVHLYKSTNHHADWLECIRTRKQPVADVEIGARTVSICHLGNICYLLKRKLQWDPAKEVFLGDDEANRLLDRPKRAPWRI